VHRSSGHSVVVGHALGTLWTGLWITLYICPL